MSLEPLVLEAKEVAALLKVSEDTVKNLNRTRKLRAVRIGKHDRWRLADVVAYVEGLGKDNGEAKR